MMHKLKKYYRGIKETIKELNYKALKILWILYSEITRHVNIAPFLVWVAGSVLLTIGCGMIYPPLGYIVAGLCCYYSLSGIK